ncbi:cytochrome-c peroxidase [Stagnihabitans tardus]|uniref:Methylamine utilization protein MauG n=1 Tax=Stagnihabitans tardus TaxID=2699202 RepID=A0AAE4Y6C4_9RHOB|nr:cytochrome c peroxidase [Stagnihabitans tardus]NBZ86671.1 c-type cytochrome [Stagnihabitans tardus]
MRRAILALCLVVPCASVSTAEVSKEVKESYRRPLTVPFPADAPYDPRIATLGKMLYFDPRLSGAQNLSCASCHNPSFGSEAPSARFIGAAGVPLGRHTPTTINVAWVSPLFWDGRAATLEEQAKGPITSPVEMNATMSQVVERLSRVPQYAETFDKLFPGEGLSEGSILKSIAMFERTLVAGWAPFDRWIEGNENAISAEAKRGFELFIGQGACANCHTGWNFTDNQFHDIGLPGNDPGRLAIDPSNPLNEHAFKTPGLRNIALRAPFMHDGTLKDLGAVLDHYAKKVIQRPSLSPSMAQITLSPEDSKAIIAFLETLTEETSAISTPVLPAN